MGKSGTRHRSMLVGFVAVVTGLLAASHFLSQTTSPWIGALISLQATTPRPEAAFVRALRQCLQRVLDSNTGDLWDNPAVPEAVNACGAELFKPRAAYRNAHENKYALEPKIDKEACLLVTLGIGNDVSSELQFQRRHPKCRFVGADPTPAHGRVYNTRLKGEYVPVAVAAQNGVLPVSLLHYVKGREQYISVNKSVVELSDFFLQKAPLVVDHLWMDNEGPEWPVLPGYLSGGAGSRLAKAGVAVCQWNVELHGNLGAQVVFPQLLQNLTRSSDVLPVFLKRIGQHMRAFLLELHHPRCRRKYID